LAFAYSVIKPRSTQPSELTLLTSICFIGAKLRNFSPNFITMRDYNEFAQSELDKLMLIQDRFKNEYKIDSYAHWFYDSDSQILRLYNDDNDELFLHISPSEPIHFHQKRGCGASLTII